MNIGDNAPEILGKDEEGREKGANNPTSEKQRFAILDVLRGLALMGIALANFPEFALWTFLGSDEQAAMSTASIDQTVRYVQYLLVDGKFYTIFSILFGIGFSLILAHHGRRLFLRRMAILVVIGFLHLMFIWSGDILLLYAIGGLLLTLFVKMTDRRLLYAWSATTGHPWGRTVHAALYAVSVIPMALSYNGCGAWPHTAITSPSREIESARLTT